MLQKFQGLWYLFFGVAPFSVKRTDDCGLGLEQPFAIDPGY